MTEQVQEPTAAAAAQRPTWDDVREDYKYVVGRVLLVNAARAQLRSAEASLSGSDTLGQMAEALRRAGAIGADGVEAIDALKGLQSANAEAPWAIAMAGHSAIRYLAIDLGVVSVKPWPEVPTQVRSVVIHDLRLWADRLEGDRLWEAVQESLVSSAFARAAQAAPSIAPMLGSAHSTLHARSEIDDAAQQIARLAAQTLEAV